MSSLIIAISAAIKVVTLLMTVHTFRNLAPHRTPATDLYTRYFIVKRNYNLLRYSLLFVAALILVELFSMSRVIFQNATVNDVQLLLSDIVFLGLVVLLSRIYAGRVAFARELEGVSRVR